MASINFEQFWTFYERLVHLFHDKHIIGYEEFFTDKEAIKQRTKEKYGGYLGFFICNDYARVNNSDIYVALNLEADGDGTIGNLVRLCNIGPGAVNKMIMQAADEAKLRLTNLKFGAENSCLLSADYYTAHLRIMANYEKKDE